MSKPKLRCIRFAYDFNDESRVVWHPQDDSGKAKGMFTVSITLKMSWGGKTVSAEHSGPPSAKASLHWLKWAKKDHPYE